MKRYLFHLCLGLSLIYSAGSLASRLTLTDVKVSSLAVDAAIVKVTLDSMPATTCNTHLLLDMEDAVVGFANKLHYSILLTAMSISQNLDVRYDDASCAIDLVKMH